MSSYYYRCIDCGKHFEAIDKGGFYEHKQVVDTYIPAMELNNSMCESCDPLKSGLA